MPVVSTAGNQVSIGAYVIDASKVSDYYIINSQGTTDFTDFGSVDNVVGTQFTASGTPDGTGTVSLASDIIFTRFTEFQLKIGMSGSNQAVYPKASQLRAIALQK